MHKFIANKIILSSTAHLGNYNKYNTNLESSCFFEEMIKHPLHETCNKGYKLTDLASRTFDLE